MNAAKGHEHRMPTRDALVLSGGGARGAYQVGVLKALGDTLPEGAQPFRIVTGVSVGALNAVMIAAARGSFRERIAVLEGVWRELHCNNVFKTDGGEIRRQVRSWVGAAAFGWAGASPPPSILDNEPLHRLLDSHVDFGAVNGAIANGDLDALAITASSYESGQAVTFFAADREIEPWTRARRIGVRTVIGAEHVLASSALPLVFPAVRVSDHYYGDGALRENAPLSAAIHLGCDRILTIGARDGTPDALDAQGAAYPSVGILAGQALDILFNDDTDADIERLRRINHTLGLMRPDARAETNLRPIGLRNINPSEDIRGIAGRHVEELPGSVRMLMRMIGALKAPWVLPSYLMFEPGYIDALLDLGYRDGLAAFREEPFL
jgi:NTE family protein